MFEVTTPRPDPTDPLTPLSAAIRHEAVPADLQADCDAAVLAALAALAAGPSDVAVRRRGFRLVWPAGLVAAALLLVLLLAPGGDDLVFADMVQALKAVEAVTVEGWVRGEDGSRVPYRQWVGNNGSIRASFGSDGEQIAVTVTGGRRLVRTPDGTVYRGGADRRPNLTLDQLMLAIFQGYESRDAWDSHWEASREDLGGVVRFRYRDRASLGQGPGRFRTTWDADAQTGRPVRCEVQELADGRWWIVSELRFTGFDGASDLADLDPGPHGAATQPMTPMDRSRLWFAMGIGGPSVVRPAVLVPRGGVQATVLDPHAARFAGISGGGTTAEAGGVTEVEMLNMDLASFVGTLTGMPAVPNDLTKRRLSLQVAAKSALPWAVKLAPVLEATGLSARQVAQERQTTVFRFALGDSLVRPSAQRFPKRSVTADSVGYHFTFERVALRDVCQTMMGNSNLMSEVGVDWRVEFADDPRFDTPVDLNCSIPGQDWRPHLELLGKVFGLTWERVQVNDRVGMIELYEPGPFGE